MNLEQVRDRSGIQGFTSIPEALPYHSCPRIKVNSPSVLLPQLQGQEAKRIHYPSQGTTPHPPAQHTKAIRCDLYDLMRSPSFHLLTSSFIS